MSDPDAHELDFVEADPPVRDAGSRRIAVYLDLSGRPNNHVRIYLAATGTPLAGACTIRATGHDRWLLPGEVCGWPSVPRASSIREFADAHDARRIMLFAAASFPMTVLIGRRLN